MIDPDTDTWYFTAKTYADPSLTGRPNGRYWFHAIDVNTLNEKAGFPKGLEGTIASNNPDRMFQSGNAHQRPALLLTGQYVYAGKIYRMKKEVLVGSNDKQVLLPIASSTTSQVG